MHGKPTYKKDNGSASYKSNFSSAAGVSVNNRSQVPSGLRFVFTEFLVLTVCQKSVLQCLNQWIGVKSAAYLCYPWFSLAFLSL